MGWRGFIVLLTIALLEVWALACLLGGRSHDALNREVKHYDANGPIIIIDVTSGTLGVYDGDTPLGYGQVKTEALEQWEYDVPVVIYKGGKR